MGHHQERIGAFLFVCLLAGWLVWFLVNTNLDRRVIIPEFQLGGTYRLPWVRLTESIGER